MTDIIINKIHIIAFAAFMFLLTVYKIRRFRRRKMAEQAAALFREKVLAELKGLYPIPRYLDKDVCDKFRGSIPEIETAAAQYRPFIPRGIRGAFDSALKKYRDHCSIITWEECVTYNIVPRGPDEIGPKEVFRQNVNALLSFAKNK